MPASDQTSNAPAVSFVNTIAPASPLGVAAGTTQGRSSLSDRVRYEQQAKLFEAVTSATPDFVYVFDLQGRFLYANRRLLEMWGMQIDEVIGKTCSELGYEQWHHEMHMREIAEVIRTKRSIKGEAPISAPKTGIFGVYEHIFSPVLSEAGEVEMIAGTSRDVTGRKRQEEQLQRNQDTFYHLIRKSPFGIYVVDGDFRMRQVSAGAEKMFRNVNPLLGRDFAEILRVIWSEPFASELIDLFRQTLATGEVHSSASTVERRHDIAEVEAYDWRIERLMLPDGLYGVVCYFYDFSERQRWEAALRLSEERFQLASRATSDAIWDWDLTTNMIWWNEGIQTIFGYTQERMATIEWWTEQVHPSDRDRVSFELNEVQSEGHTIWRSEYRFRRADGEYANVLDRGFVMRNAEGKAVRMVGAMQDLTARKKAEAALVEAQEELRLHAENLEHLVAERTAKLRETIAELETLSYSISHDMRAPLRAMQGFAQAVLDEHKSTLDAEGVSYLERISSAAERLDALIQDILLYTSVGRERLELEPISLEPLIREVLLTHHPDQVSRVTICAPFPPVLGHEAFLSQIISNLLTNALKFVKTGEAPEVRIHSEVVGDFVKVWIEDRGIGIAPQHLEQIFQVFGRLHSEAEFPGTGIGLAIVKRAVQRLGGEVGVESVEGGGSRFWFTVKKA